MSNKSNKNTKNKNQIITIVLVILAVVIALAFAVAVLVRENLNNDTLDQDNEQEDTVVVNQFEMPKENEEIALLSTNHGEIYIRLFPDVAPKAVENFTTHINEGYYDGVTFHRVINDFMIQGGDPGDGGKSIWGESFEDEFNDSVHNYRGALSMANAGSNTNGSQFFIVQAGPLAEAKLNQMISYYGLNISADEKANYINYGGTPWLDGKHTVFGQVIKGMDVVDEIVAVAVDANDKPVEDVVIEKAMMVEYHKSDFEK